MKIKSVLILLTLTFLILIITIGFIMFLTFGQINRKLVQYNNVNEMMKEVSELSIVTHEYFIHHGERMQQQWLLQYDAVAKELERIKKEETQPEHLSILESITSDYKIFGDLFSRVQANLARRERLIKENKPQKEIDITIILGEREMAHALMIAQKITSEAFKFSTMTREEITRVQQRANLIIIFSIIGFAIFSFYISFLTIRAITKPINELIKGAEIIGRGDFEYKIDLKTKNEMGQLANSFNKMTEDLQKITVTKDKLEKEITERKKVEKEEKRLSAELAQKNKELEQIIYATSHDLRSPLVNVQGFSKELSESIKELNSVIRNEKLPVNIRKKLAHFLEQDIPESLQYILTSASKMDSLLSGLLRLSRLGRAALKIEKIDMNKLIDKVVEASEFQIKQSDTKLEVSELPSCRGDKVQVNQVFSNLIENALKYLDPNHQGIIKILGHKKNAQSVYCVEDNGIGIASEHKDRIFGLFQQLEPATHHGEGLGLTIVRCILDRHGGKIWVESESGKGSKFYVSLPGA